MKKRLVQIIVVSLMIGMLSIQASAAENESIISFEEYASAIEAEYAKYGIEGGVYAPDGEFFCTSELLEADLTIVREYATNRTAREVPILAKSYDVPSDSIRPMGMIGTVEMTDSYIYIDISNPLLPNGCTIKTTAVITVDYQNAYIVSVSTPELEVVSGTGVADWIEYVSHSTTINQSKKSVRLDIVCNIKKEITLGAITSWGKEEISYTANFKNIPC